MTPQDRLRTYASLASSIISSETEKTLALVAARWIEADPTASRDPLLTDLWVRVNMSESLQSAPQSLFGIDMLMAGPVTCTTSSRPPAVGRQPRSIMDFFGTSTASLAPQENRIASSPPSSKKPESPTSSPTSQKPESPPSSPLLIYCDGACSANGRRGAKAAYGVSVWSNGVEREAISKPLVTTEPQTNQRAELRGLQVALAKALASPGAAVEIHTDSKYAMDCLQTWGAGWAARGWRKADGGAVLHQDILRPMWDAWRTRGPGIRIFHVSAHTGRTDVHSRGNARADELATGALVRN